MYQYIDEAATLGVRLVVFSGGEPFLLGTDLHAAVRHAVSRKLFTRVVSNAYWATSENVALAELSKLQEAGLCEINFSTGENHQQFVPVKNVIHGIRAAFELGMTCAIMIESHGQGSYGKKAFRDEQQAVALIRSAEAAGKLIVFDSPWVDVARDASIESAGCHLLTRRTLGSRVGCPSIIASITVDPDEQMGACCGITRRHIPELTIGSLKEQRMEVLTDLMKRDFLKRWLFTVGPEQILAWAAQQNPEIRWEGKYAHQCHACYTVYHSPLVRKVIVEHYQPKILDVSFQYWMKSKHMEQELVRRAE